MMATSDDPHRPVPTKLVPLLNDDVVVRAFVELYVRGRYGHDRERMLIDLVVALATEKRSIRDAYMKLLEQGPAPIVIVRER
jgi:hypothetical protein